MSGRARPNPAMGQVSLQRAGRSSVGHPRPIPDHGRYAYGDERVPKRGTVLAVPMLKGDEFIGVMVTYARR